MLLQLLASLTSKSHPESHPLSAASWRAARVAVTRAGSWVHVVAVTWAEEPEKPSCLRGG